MARKRTTYTAEFKLQAVRMILDQKQSVAEVARRLDVGENPLRIWAKAFRERGRRLPRSRLPRPGRRRAATPPRRGDPPAGRAGPPKKSRRRLRQPAELTFRFIAGHADQWPITWLCEALEVSASGYHAWAARADSPTEFRRQELVAAMHEIRAEMTQRYGSPRMTAELNARGYECSENAVAKRMTAHGIRARTRRRFARTTDSDHGRPVAPNLLARCFGPSGPKQSWGTDITYLPTAEGWLDLAVVEDLFRRMVVGGSMAATMESRRVVDALEMAMRLRRPDAGLLAHSDRGRQYASDHYQRVLASAGIVCGMSGVGQCCDNAPVESLFGRLKCELGVGRFDTRDQARTLVFEYLEVFHNRVRRHSALGYVSPAEYERAHDQTHR